MTDQSAASAGSLGNIQHFVVLMLENRSFDHLLGALKAKNPAVDGALNGEFSNHKDPASTSFAAIATGPATEFALPFDPGHEFQDIQIQLYGRAPSAHRAPAPRVDPAPMSVFVYSAEQNAAEHPSNSAMVMQCFRNTYSSNRTTTPAAGSSTAIQCIHSTTCARARCS